MKKHWIVKVLKFAVFATLAVNLLGWAVMSLWNWLMPALFGVPLISFLQAIGLLVLSRILFGRFGGGPGGGMHWRYRMKERWGQMSSDEREKFFEGMRGRSGARSSMAFFGVIVLLSSLSACSSSPACFFVSKCLLT